MLRPLLVRSQAKGKTAKAAKPVAGARDLLAPIASPQDTHRFGIPDVVEEGWVPVPSHGDGLHDLVLKPASHVVASSTDCFSHPEPDPNAAAIEDSHHYAKIGIDGAPLHAIMVYYQAEG